MDKNSTGNGTFTSSGNKSTSLDSLDEVNLIFFWIFTVISGLLLGFTCFYLFYCYIKRFPVFRGRVSPYVWEQREPQQPSRPISKEHDYKTCKDEKMEEPNISKIQSQINQNEEREHKFPSGNITKTLVNSFNNDKSLENPNDVFDISNTFDFQAEPFFRTLKFQNEFCSDISSFPEHNSFSSEQKQSRTQDPTLHKKSSLLHQSKRSSSIYTFATENIVDSSLTLDNEDSICNNIHLQLPKSATHLPTQTKHNLIKTHPTSSSHALFTSGASVTGAQPQTLRFELLGSFYNCNNKNLDLLQAKGVFIHEPIILMGLTSANISRPVFTQESLGRFQSLPEVTDLPDSSDSTVLDVHNKPHQLSGRPLNQNHSENVEPQVDFNMIQNPSTLSNSLDFSSVPINLNQPHNTNSHSASRLYYYRNSNIGPQDIEDYETFEPQLYQVKEEKEAEEFEENQASCRLCHQLTIFCECPSGSENSNQGVGVDYLEKEDSVVHL